MKTEVAVSHFTAPRMAKIGELRITLDRLVWYYLVKLNYHAACDPAILSLGILSTEQRGIHIPTKRHAQKCL